MSFSKIICVVDNDVDVQNPKSVIWRVLANLDPKRDLSFVDGPVDQLDHAANQALWGGKMAIDGTRKWPEEGYARAWPAVALQSDAIKRRVDAIWNELGIPLVSLASLASSTSFAEPARRAPQATTSVAPIANASARKASPRAHADANRAMFDRIAPTYDLLNRMMSFGIDKRWRARAAKMIAEAMATRHGAVLDLCAGTLDLSAMLEGVLPASTRLVACDASEKMLALGNHKVMRTEIVVGDALALPFANASFSAVVCGFGMRNLSNLAKGVREVHRVLEPGGVFVTLELFAPTLLRTRMINRALLDTALPALGSVVAGDRQAYGYLSESMRGFVARGDYERVLRSEGFGLVTSFDLVFGMASLVRATSKPEHEALE
jgi:ubiquinone/menaquinone biosynthesis methyltransferase